MVRGNMLRWGWAVVGVAMSLAGCTCGEPQVDCTDTTISFETPTAGQTVDSPFEVTFSVKAPDGAAFAIDAATLKVGTQTLDATSVSGNRATFSGLTAVAGEVTLTPTIAEGSCSKTGAPISITVRDTCSTPQVMTVTFPQDEPPNGVPPRGVLNRAELPDGTNLQVKVTASCVADGVQVRILQGTTVVGPLSSFVNGEVTITTTLPDSDDTRYDLFAELVKDGTVLNTRSGNPTALGSIAVNRVIPSCAVVTSGTLGRMDDADLTVDGFQVRVTGTMAPGSAGTIAINGQTPVAVAAEMSGAVAAGFTVADTGDTTYQVSMICSNTAGNTNTASGSFRVDLQAPTVAITSPANVDGGATMPVTQSPASFTITTDAEDGSLVEILRNGVTQSTVTVMNGTATFPVAFGTDGTYTITVRVTDTADNTSSASVVVQVTLDGCGAAFTRPSTCPALITTSQVSSGSYVFQSTSKASCSGQAAQLFRSEVLVDGGITAEVSAASATIASTGVATYPGIPVASGQYIFRSAVTNIGPDAGVSEATCQVTVDLDGPAITSPVQPTNQPYAIVNANQDDLPSVPGVQRPARLGGLTFSARVPSGGRVDVCTTQAVNAATGQTRPTSAECGSGWYVLFQGAVSPVDLFTFPDGEYQIKIVVVGGGLATAPSSPPLPILSDSIRPCITARALPQDQSADSRLNIAELDGGQPQLAFALGCGDTGPTALAATNPVVVRNIVAGAAGPTRTATPVFANGQYVVTVPVTAASEADLSLFIELTDLAGNRNTYQATNDPSSYAFRVDLVAPSCSIVTPSATQTLVGIAGAPGGQFSTQVATSSDVATNGVSVTFGSTTRALTPSNLTAQTDFAVTGTQAYTMAATCTDASGNSTSATPRTLTIDLDRPTCALTSPTAGTTYNTNRLATTVAVSGADGRNVTIRSDLQVAPITTSLLVTSGTASATLQYPKGVQTISAEVTDAAGNACTLSTVTGVNITSDACLLEPRNVATNFAGNWKNRSSISALTNLTATTGSMSGVIANSTDCRSGERVTLQKVAPTPAGTLIELVTAANGDVVLSAPLTVTDGETWTVTAYSSTNTTSSFDVRVGLAVPAATSVTLGSFVPAAGQPIYFVAPDDNFNLDPLFGTPKTDRYFPDSAPTTAGAQVAIDVTGTTGLVYGSSGGKVEVFYAPVPSGVLSADITTVGAALGSTVITLPHNTSGTFRVQLTSASGNVADVYTASAAVDVIAPAEPAMSPLTLVDARAATVNVGWSTVYDDDNSAGSGALDGTGSPTTKGYDLRWTTGAVYNNAQLATEASYYSASNVSSIVTAPGPLQLPPLNTYYVVVRARDEVGNYSRLLPSSDSAAITKTQSLDNMWDGGVLVTVSGTSSDFGTTIAAENSIVGDGLADTVVAAPGRGSAGSVYVFKGRSPFNGFTGACAASTDAGVDCQEITAPDTMGTAFGGDVSTDGNLTDDTEVGVADLVIGQRGYSSGTGRVVIFLGTRAATIDTSRFIEIRGNATNTGIGQTARIVGDIDGDGFDELAISAFNFGTGRGRIYIFKGRPFTAWPASPIAITAADWVIEGESILPADPVNTSNGLGLARLSLLTTSGFTGRTRADGGVAPELIVPLSRTNLSKVVLYGYDRLSGSSVAAPLGLLDGGIQTISRTPTGTTNNNAYLGFGSASFAGSVLSARDLFVGSPSRAEVQYFQTWDSTGATAGNNTGAIAGPVGFGGLIAAGDLGAGTEKDLVVAEGSLSSNGVWVLYQRAGAFPPSIGGTNIRFWFSEIRPTRPAQVSVSTYVIQTKPASLGDVDGSGSVDLLVADPSAGSIRVWR